MSYMSSDNLWYQLLQLNLELLTESNKVNANFYQTTRIAVGKTRSQYSNFFGLDGRSYENICSLCSDLYNNKVNLKLPNFDKSKATLFFNDGEGHSPNELFNALHLLIDALGLTGPCTYQNSSVNVSEIYEEFCNDTQTLPKMSVGYTGNPAFFDSNNVHYSLPEVIPFDEKPLVDKKLFCSFNWNPWEHRLGLIALLHHYELLDDGYVTSPGKNKYGYNENKDFSVLVNCVQSYLKNLDVYPNVLQSIYTLKAKYPLKIDDRSQYTDTDTPLMDKQLKLPLYEARINSLFEIITETRFTKEHWFSEKTFWPIKVGLPFLIINGSGCLNSLKKLGFQTYSDYIDESYDNETNIPFKIQKVVLELKRLQNLRQNDPYNFFNIYSKMKDISLHNAEVFKNHHVSL